MQKRADNIKTVEHERIKLAIVAANNHYTGFGPGTVNIFRNMLDRSEVGRKGRGTRATTRSILRA